MMKQYITRFIWTQTFIPKSDINDVFEPIYGTIIWNIEQSLGKGSGRIIYSVIDHNINI